MVKAPSEPTVPRSGGAASATTSSGAPVLCPSTETRGAGATIALCNTWSGAAGIAGRGADTALRQRMKSERRSGGTAKETRGRGRG